jgi:hypothetical protein
MVGLNSIDQAAIVLRCQGLRSAPTRDGCVEVQQGSAIGQEQPVSVGFQETPDPRSFLPAPSRRLAMRNLNIDMHRDR